MKTATIYVKDGWVNTDGWGRKFTFAFDPQTDDPAEGVTLTGIFEDGQRIRPSSVPDSEIPYEAAARELGIS